MGVEMKKMKFLGHPRGAVLVTGLIVLLVLSLIGLAVMQSTTLQERMAGNLEQRDAAFQAAEAGLRDAEAWIEETVLLPAAFDNTNGLYQPAGPGEKPRWDQVDWNAIIANYRTYRGNDLGNPPPYPLPRYIVEFLTTTQGDESDSAAFGAVEGEGARVFRITSRGVSPNGLVVVMLQSTYIR